MPLKRPPPLSEAALFPSALCPRASALGVTNNGQPLPIKNTFIDAPSGSTPTWIVASRFQPVSTAPAVVNGSCYRTRSSPASASGGLMQKTIVLSVRTPSTGVPPTPFGSGGSEVGQRSLDGERTARSNQSNQSNHSSAVCSPVVWPSTPLSRPITPVLTPVRDVTLLREYHAHELTPVREYNSGLDLSLGMSPPPKESPRFSPTIQKGLEVSKFDDPPPFPAPQPAPPPAAAPHTITLAANRSWASTTSVPPPTEPPKLPFDLQIVKADFIPPAEPPKLQSVSEHPVHRDAPRQAPSLSLALQQEPPPPPMVSPKVQQQQQQQQMLPQQQLQPRQQQQSHRHVQMMPSVGSSSLPKFQPPTACAPAISQFSIPAPPMVSPKSQMAHVPTPKRLSFFGA